MDLILLPWLQIANLHPICRNQIQFKLHNQVGI